MTKVSATFIFLWTSLTSNVLTGAQNQKGVDVKLEAKSGSKVSGQLKLIPQKGGVMIMGAVTGLNPNQEHGFHVHETGDCSAADGASAGGHFNPHGASHGDSSKTGHLGDLGNLKADKQGHVKVSVLVNGATLDGGKSGISGRALVIHGQRDDLKTQPAGNAGPRVACGVIPKV